MAPGQTPKCGSIRGRRSDWAQAWAIPRAWKKGLYIQCTLADGRSANKRLLTLEDLSTRPDLVPKRRIRNARPAPLAGNSVLHRTRDLNSCLCRQFTLCLWTLEVEPRQFGHITVTAQTINARSVRVRP